MTGLSVECITLANVPRASEQPRRGHPTYNGTNYTVRSWGAVVGNYPTMERLLAAWPELAGLVDESAE